MKTAIIYFSKHHGNTKKVLDFLCQHNDITLMDASCTTTADLTAYDRIGFASGIYYSKFHKSVLQFAKSNLPDHKPVFFLYTYGAKKDGYTNAIRKITDQKSAPVLGEFGCFGFNTFGPFKLIGGIAKGHPDHNDYDAAQQFFNSL